MKLRKTIIVLLAMVAILQSSCANQSKNKNSAMAAPQSAADSIHEDEAANAAVFSDITDEDNKDVLASVENDPLSGVIEAPTQNLVPSKNSPNKADASSTFAAAANNTDFFYRPVGGERLGRVAYALYGDRKMALDLAAINPGLQLGSTLSQEQAIYFEAEKLNPRSMFLTKDLIERYPDVLQASIEKNGQTKDLTSVAKGETLQEVSQRLYGTTRYWTELYLLNRQKISGFDRIPSGLELSYIKHDSIGTIAAAPTQNKPTQQVVDSQLDSQGLAENTPVENNSAPQAIEDSAPALVPPPALETSPATPMAEVSKVVENANPGKEKPGFWTPANMRKAIYILLVALVIGLAAFMTRSGGRKNMDGVEEQRKVI